MDYTSLSLYEISKLLKERKVTSVELTKQCLDRIEEKRGLNALISIRSEALEDAKKADEILDKGEGSYLTGVPLIIKDNS